MRREKMLSAMFSWLNERNDVLSELTGFQRTNGDVLLAVADMMVREGFAVNPRRRRVRRKERSVEDDIRGWIVASMKRRYCKWPMSRSDVKRKVFGMVGGQTWKMRCEQYLKIALENGMLVSSSVKKKGHFMVVPSPELSAAAGIETEGGESV